MGGPISKSLIQFSVDGQGCVPSLLFTWGLGLDLIERVPDDLWTEVHDIVQDTGIKTIPKKNKCKKAKWLSKEALQIAVQRREVKIKDTKGTFHAKMASIKDRNGMDLKEAEDIKKRWQEYTEELNKKTSSGPR